MTAALKRTRVSRQVTHEEQLVLKQDIQALYEQVEQKKQQIWNQANQLAQEFETQFYQYHKIKLPQADTAANLHTPTKQTPTYGEDGLEFQTPAMDRDNGIVIPSTKKRTLRRGESFYSATGSPLAASSLLTDFSNNQVTILREHPINGQYLDIKNPSDTAKLDPHERTKMRNQIQSLQQALDDILQSLPPEHN